MIDSHAHLGEPEFPDRDEALARAEAAGVRRIICVGAGRDLASARSAVELANRDPRVWAAVAIHPHDAGTASDADFTELAQLAAQKRVVAVGETGLDYHYNHSAHDVQQQVFRRFVQIGRQVGKPIVVHVRDAHDHARRILDEERAAEVGAIIHCFTGTMDDARAYLERGFYISFSGIVTFKTAAELRAVAAFVPDERLLLETDCPYLAPIPMRGKRNEPAFMVHTAAVIATARNRTVEQVDQASEIATQAAFHLPA